MFVGVRCRVGSIATTDTALLDTGAEWSVIGADLAEYLQAELGPSLDQITLSTRHGPIRGALHRIKIELMADPDLGANLVVDCTCAVMRDWPGPVVLGYRGFLERTRITIDPGNGSATTPMIYFSTAD